MELSKILRWSPRIIALTVLLVWSVGIVFLYAATPTFIIGAQVWIVLALTTGISWKNELFGGIIWIFWGVILFLVALGNKFTFASTIPLFLIGSLHVYYHFYDEKLDLKSKEI